MIMVYNNKPNNIKLFLKKLDKRMVDSERSPAWLILAEDLNSKTGKRQEEAECSLEKEMDVSRRNSENGEMRLEGELLLNCREPKAMLIMNSRRRNNYKNKKIRKR